MLFYTKEKEATRSNSVLDGPCLEGAFIRLVPPIIVAYHRQAKLQTLVHKETYRTGHPMIGRSSCTCTCTAAATPSLPGVPLVFGLSLQINPLS